MTPEAFTAALAALGLSQARLARILDLSRGTPNRWATGALPVPSSVALLLAAWTANPALIPADPERTA